MEKQFKIIVPENEIVHAGDEIHFSVYMEKEGDQDQNFIQTDHINFYLNSLDNKKFKPIDIKNAKPVYFKKDNKIKYILKIKRYLAVGSYEAKVFINPINGKTLEELPLQFDVIPPLRPLKLAKDTEIGVRGPIFKRPVDVSLQGAGRNPSSDQLLWILIRNRTIDFNTYADFIDGVLCDNNEPPSKGQKVLYANRLPFHNVASYSLLKYATEAYLMQECGIVPKEIDLSTNDWVKFNKTIDTDDEEYRTKRAGIDMADLRDKYLKELFEESKSVGYSLPYLDIIRRKLRELKLKTHNEISLDSFGKVSINACYGILKSKLLGPCMLELIWSYWHEEGGLVQTMNAISRRFQNIRNGYGRDPLANFNLDPLRPLNNLLWGYIEDERNRLSMSRRNLEYQYEYGISLIGKAVPQIGVAEHRTNFIRGFHNLLKACIEFYNQANFTTVIPDGFPLLNHLREVHLLLAEGAHNQYGDLPWTSRIEMLIQQWLLSRTEMREFIGGRIMVPYAEAWMDKVDTMKTLQGWNDTNITHFHDLAVFGEQLLLSIRFGSWNATTNVGATNAANWAHYWRNEVQRYVHAYNAVTGVDLSADITDARVQLPTMEDRFLPPAVLIQKQVDIQKSRQQYALQNNGIQPGLLQNGQVNTLPSQPIPQRIQQPMIPKKLNG